MIKAKSVMMDQPKQHLIILVVDDDDLNQQMMTILLSGQGYVVKTASNGQEALDAITSSNFDLVFMDLQLPDMNGLEASRRIREWEAGRTRLPIIALTANDIPGAALEWLKAGVDDYIFKPYNLGQLSRMIMLYVDGQDKLSSSLDGSSLTEIGADEVSFDPKLALLNFSNDSDAYKGLLKDFIASLPERIELMYEHQVACDLSGLSRKAHNLKGVSANLGAIRLTKLANRLERCCKENQPQLSENVLKEINESVSDLRIRVMDFLGSSST